MLKQLLQRKTDNKNAFHLIDRQVTRQSLAAKRGERVLNRVRYLRTGLQERKTRLTATQRLRPPRAVRHDSSAGRPALLVVRSYPGGVRLAPGRKDRQRVGSARPRHRRSPGGECLARRASSERTGNELERATLRQLRRVVGWVSAPRRPGRPTLLQSLSGMARGSGDENWIAGRSARHSRKNPAPAMLA